MDDYQLTGTGLENRVAILFERIGCTATLEPRGKKEDVLLEPPVNWNPQQSIAVEAKGKTVNDHLDTSDLRQLDDWIFELSGEQDIRRRTLALWQNPLVNEQYIGTKELAMKFHVTKGAIPYSIAHPKPVKGLVVFNGPTSKPFEDRDADWCPPNEREFAEKRSFCVMTLEQLLRWVDACGEDAALKSLFWQTLHDTFGPCPDPPSHVT